MKRFTGSGAPLPMRPNTSLMLRSVRSGFCSEPDSANSRPMMRSLSTNHEWSWPPRVMCASAPSESKPGKSGTGNRLPCASSQSGDGPLRIRMP